MNFVFPYVRRLFFNMSFLLFFKNYPDSLNLQKRIENCISYSNMPLSGPVVDNLVLSTVCSSQLRSQRGKLL